MTESQLARTRVANACVLIELDGHAILTDPYFTERWYMKRGEPLGLTLDELPPLTAVVASSSAPNRWDLRALRACCGQASSVPVFVSTARMARQARALGYRSVEQLRWGATRAVGPGASIEAVPAGRTLHWPNNAYLLSGERTRVLFGGEVGEVTALGSGPVTVALLPVNGLRPVLGQPLVMGPAQAVDGAVALGARVLVPVHEAHADDLLSLVFHPHGTAAEARELAASRSGAPEVVCLEPGQRWEYPAAGLR